MIGVVDLVDAFGRPSFGRSVVFSVVRSTNVMIVVTVPRTIVTVARTIVTVARIIFTMMDRRILIIAPMCAGLLDRMDMAVSRIS